MTTMNIERLQITNFRRFAKLEIDFDPQLTVLVARNGQGKTSVLDAITIALATFVGAFDRGKGKGLAVKDARYQLSADALDSVQHFPVVVSAQLSLTSPADGIAEAPAVRHDVLRELTGPKSKTSVKHARSLTNEGKTLQQLVNASAVGLSMAPVALPVIAYYGSGRLWRQHKEVKRAKVLSDSRTMGYEDCLSSASSYLQLQQWMQQAAQALFQEQSLPEHRRRPGLAQRVKAIGLAVDQALAEQGWADFRYSTRHRELAMYHPDAGELPVSMLSDGVRAMVLLVADLAFRCVRLNGHLGEQAVRDSCGLVLIDEVDLHLHPEWQQRVLNQLRVVFPRLQFIVTTHSPQVLSTVSRQHIRVLGDADNLVAVAAEPMAEVYGLPSNSAMQVVMGVDPVPPVPERGQLEALSALVDEGRYGEPEVVELLAQLTRVLGERHPQLQRIMRSIHRQKALNR